MRPCTLTMRALYAHQRASHQTWIESSHANRNIFLYACLMPTNPYTVGKLTFSKSKMYAIRHSYNTLKVYMICDVYLNYCYDIEEYRV